MREDKKTGFTRLDPNDDLVKMLISEIWWNELVKLSHEDKDINIQLRPHSINVYSKMGNLLKIRLQEKKICCTLHYKYLIAPKKPEYVNITNVNGHLKVIADDEGSKIKGNICPHIEDILQPLNLKVIKANIATYVGKEKIIQSQLVEKNKDTILDVEVAFSEKSGHDDSDREDTRIDFINFDKITGKLVLVELKQIFDGRLYSNDINKQIKKYYAFAIKNEVRIIEAYQNVIKTKKKLGIIKEKSYLAKVEISAIEPRPLLVIAGFNQNVIDGLSDKIISHLQESIYENRLAGLYFFGKDVDLNMHKQKNKKLF
jgi:hypothetical protein